MIWKIAWKNIVYKPLSSILCITLILFGVGIISLLMIIQQQFEDKFKRDLKNTDVVVGAKGSPLQLVLSSIYHIDDPTGNIKLADAKKIMERPLNEEVIPLAYGDSYKGFRILGTTKAYINKYDAKTVKGRVYRNAMETTLGASIAKKTGLKVGDIFVGTHGKVKGSLLHEDHPYTVVGILNKTGSVLDNLILTPVESVWQVHATHGHHAHKHHDEHTKNDEKELTAILIKCKSKLEMMRLPRIINQQTNMQAVLPGLEINRLFSMLGVGITTLNVLGSSIMGIAGFSVFLVLFSRLRERSHELALMRSVGYRSFKLFNLLLIEGAILSLIGYIFGLLFSRLGLYFINRQAINEFNLSFGTGVVQAELMLLLITLGIGIVAALVPALKAMRMDVSSILTKN